jgi:hypothetical protein
MRPRNNVVSHAALLPPLQAQRLKALRPPHREARPAGAGVRSRHDAP